MYCSLKILSLNTQSVNSKKESLRDYYDQNRDIFCLHETWLNPDILDNEIIPSSYKVCQHDRTDGYSGVLIAVKLNEV